MMLYAIQRPGFEGYNARYAAKDPLFSDISEPNKDFIGRMIEFYDGKPNFSLLDIGCGQGYFTSFMHQKALSLSPSDAEPYIVGLDGAGVAVAQADVREPGVRWINDTLQHFLADHDRRFPERRYDMIVDRGGTTVIESEKEAVEIVNRIHGLLRPGGMYVFLSAEAWYRGGGTVKPPHLTWSRDWMSVVKEAYRYVIDGSEAGYHQNAYLK